MYSYFLKFFTAVFFTLVLSLGFSGKAEAGRYTCHFSCIRRSQLTGICCTTGRCSYVGSVSDILTRLDRSSVVAAGYLVNPVYYTIQQRDVAIESASADTCGASDCLSTCQAQCGGRLASAGELSGEQEACLDAVGRPAYVRNDFDTACRTGILNESGDSYSPAPTDLPYIISSTRLTAPSCDATPLAAATDPSGGTACTTPAPAIPANAAPKRCSFFCIQTGMGPNDTTVDTAGNTCSNARLISHTGRVACSAAGECACVDECKSTCGAVGGKSLCFLGSGNPDQVNICHGATGVAQAHAPTCSADAAAAGSPTTLTNPLNTTDIGELIARFIRAITGIAGSMALLMMVVGGVIWMTAEGSDRVQVGQTIIKNSFLGLILIFFAFSLVSLFLAVLGL